MNIHIQYEYIINMNIEYMNIQYSYRNLILDMVIPVMICAYF